MQNNSLKSQFLIDTNITFLNFGSFGACPKPVFEEYQRLQLELEKESVQFIAFGTLIGFVVTAAIVAVVWWLNRAGSDWL